MLRFVTYLLHIFVFFLLTLLTQIGGIVYIITVWIGKKYLHLNKWKTLSLFILFYILCTFLVIPGVAQWGGRTRIKNNENLRAVSYLSIWLNRNYVSDEMSEVLIEIANDQNLIDHNLQLRYLDACFPFINGFPLMPHLSHNDGRKVDISLVYETADGEWVNKSKSVSGYGVFEAPTSFEKDQPDFCKEQGYWQYDFPKYLTLGKRNEDLIFSRNGTRLLIQSILDNSKVNKLFIEPHLKQRIGLHDSRIRYHGCHAVRHDDHIHIQL